MIRLKKKRHELTREKFLNDEEHDLLVAHLKRYAKRHPRDTGLIFLSLYTGARAREVLNMRFSDLDQGSRAVTIYGIKNSYNRTIPIPGWLFKQVLSLPKSESGRIFDISYQRLNQVWKKWRTTKKKFHSLRHTFAVRAYKRTKDLLLIQSALGHKQRMNTMIYLDFVYSNEQLRRILVEE